jgi:hypothetical protein
MSTTITSLILREVTPTATSVYSTPSTLSLTLSPSASAAAARNATKAEEAHIKSITIVCVFAAVFGIFGICFGLYYLDVCIDAMCRGRRRRNARGGVHVGNWDVRWAIVRIWFDGVFLVAWEFLFGNFWHFGGRPAEDRC